MKVWAYLAIAVLLVGAATAGIKSIHAAGYNKRDREVQQEIIEVQQQAAASAEARWSASVIAATEAIRIEERIIEQIREVEVLVPTVVEKIITLTPECADLGPDYARLLNDQVRAGNRIPSPTSARQPDG